MRDFCRKWNIAELAVFGSVLRGDFGPESDVDVLVRLPAHTEANLYDWVEMIQELEALVGRRVDLVEESTIVNPYRLRSIQASKRTLYAA